MTEVSVCLNTIRFYIILKPNILLFPFLFCLNTIRFYIILKLMPAKTNLIMSLNTIRFYIILKLHHRPLHRRERFEYYTFLHHSQTLIIQLTSLFMFEYYTFLHHSQTEIAMSFFFIQFEYYTFLHHSQTSNSKMKRLICAYRMIFKP